MLLIECDITSKHHLMLLAEWDKTAKGRLRFQAIHLRFTVGKKWQWDRFFSDYFDFPPSLLFHLCPTIIRLPVTDAVPTNLPTDGTII